VKRATVLHQAVADGAPPDEQDTLAAAGAVARALRDRGWTVTMCAMGLDLAAAEDALRSGAPDLVFNLVESLGGADVLAVAAPALLERLTLPYTGADPAALALTADKRATRRALRRAGIVVPPGPEDGWPGPFIVKHATCHASHGLGAHSVVSERPLPDDGWYAEAFIDGREFNVSLLAEGGDVAALPVAELLFQDWPPDRPRILDYAGKWHADDPVYQRTRRGFDVAPDLARSLADVARRCWRALGLSGYARVDLRLDRDGIAYVIDVNANPCLAEDAGFAAAAARAGLDFPALVAGIVAEALPPAAPPSPIALRSAPAPVCLCPGLRDDDDIAALCRATGMFTPDEIAIAGELAADHRARGAASDYRFVRAELAGDFAGYACHGRVSGTADSCDLYWIVVHPRAQGAGIGRALLHAVLAEMSGRGARRLYAETSGKPGYAPTRAFYAATGFTLQAVLPDFYGPGDSKQIWLRLLSPRSHVSASAETPACTPSCSPDRPDRLSATP
jgi:D-alanine-D-alanine ligase